MTLALHVARMEQITGRYVAADTRAPVGGMRLRTMAPTWDPVDPAEDEVKAPPWAEAAILSGFSQFSPVDGVPAHDSTEVLVWYSPTAIHFGIRAFEG